MIRHFNIALVIALVMVLRVVVPAAPLREGEDAFQEALKTEVAGDYEKALALYRRLTEEHPRSDYAGEAFFRIAAIHDEKLHDPPKAIAFYRKYLELYNGRQARRAEIRIEHLAPYEKVNPDTYRAYVDIIESYQAAGREAAMASMRRFIDENPKYPFLDEALLWLANETRGFQRIVETPEELARIDRAMKIYRRIVEEYPGTRSSIAALKNLGDCHLIRNEYSAARRFYRRAYEEGGQFGRRLVGQYMLMTKLETYRSRTFYGVAFCLPLLLLALARLVPFNRRVVRRGLRSGLRHALFFLPGALLLVFVTFYYADASADNITGREPYLMAVVMAVSLAALLLNAVAMEADREGRVNIPLYLLVLAGLHLGATYCAFYFFDLLPYVERLVI